jgi:hypothetical protein
MNATLSRKIALGLIILAVLGTEISYHFTLETRFDAIEEKLQQDTVAMQQMQESIDAMAASKSESLSGLNRQLTTLQSTFEPLGKTTKSQADALDQLRTQITSLQQAQSGQQEAQKKLSDYIAQLESNVRKARVEAVAAKPVVSAPPSVPIAPAPAPATTLSAPTAQPIPAPATPNASANDLIATPGAVAHPHEMASESPRAQVVTGMTLRPDDTDVTHSHRALPVGASLPAKN